MSDLPAFSDELTSRSPRSVHGAETLGWGLVGASRIASQFMIEAIRAQPPITVPDARYPLTNAWVVGVFSHNEERARRFADAHYLPHAFVNVSDLLNHPDIDCVYISSHPRHHAQATLAALAAGKHVLCETPLALTLEDAEALAHTALSRDLHLAVNYHRRANPAVTLLRNLLTDRVIGDLLGGRIANTALLPPSQQTWRLQSNGGGVVLDRLIHDIDLLRYLLRDEISVVHSVSTQQILGREVEEDVVSDVTMRRSGLVLQLHDSFILPHSPDCLELYGALGTFNVQHLFSDRSPDEIMLLRNGQATPIPVPAGNSYHLAMAHYCQAVRTHAPPLATAVDGIQALNAALTALESIRRGHRLRLDPVHRPLSDRAIT